MWSKHWSCYRLVVSHGQMAGMTGQLLECSLDWNISLNTHQHLYIIYLAYAEAFDSVFHTKLLAKLAQYGINDLLLIWIKKTFLLHALSVLK